MVLTKTQRVYPCTVCKADTVLQTEAASHPQSRWHNADSETASCFCQAGSPQDVLNVAHFLEKTSGTKETITCIA